MRGLPRLALRQFRFCWKPPFELATVLLWLSGPLTLALGALSIYLAPSPRPRAAPATERGRGEAAPGDRGRLKPPTPRWMAPAGQSVAPQCACAEARLVSQGAGGSSRGFRSPGRIGGAPIWIKTRRSDVE